MHHTRSPPLAPFPSHLPLWLVSQKLDPLPGWSRAVTAEAALLLSTGLLLPSVFRGDELECWPGECVPPRVWSLRSNFQQGRCFTDVSGWCCNVVGEGAPGPAYLPTGCATVGSSVLKLFLSLYQETRWGIFIICNDIKLCSFSWVTDSLCLLFSPSAFNMYQSNGINRAYFSSSFFPLYSFIDAARYLAFSHAITKLKTTHHCTWFWTTEIRWVQVPMADLMDQMRTVVREGPMSPCRVLFIHEGTLVPYPWALS